MRNNMMYYPNMNNNFIRNNNTRAPYNMGPNRFGGGFLFPFALGFVSSPLIFGATRPRPVYGPYPPQPIPYYPYY